MKKKCLVLIMAFLLLIYSPSIHIIHNCYADELINADILDQSEELPDEEVDDCPEEKYEGDSYPDFEVTIPEESGKTEDGVEEMPDLVDEYSGLRVPAIRKWIPEIRSMIPDGLTHPIRPLVLSVRQ